jgi:Rne/Rng family ribonuclease
MTGIALVADGPGETRAALLEDDRVVELLVERTAAARAGDVCLGRVVAVLPGSSAALVEISAEQPGFLERKHALAPFHEGQRLVVQVSREARGEKGAGVTARIALGGRLLALTPGRPGVRIPTEIHGHVLRDWLGPLLEGDEGVNFREDAAGASKDELEADFLALRRRWKAILDRADGAPTGPLEPAEPPLDHALAEIAATWRPDIVRIDGASAFAAAAPPARRHSLQTERADGLRADIDEALEAALLPTAKLSGAGSITIELARAATLIDVDAAGARNLGEVNRAAATEAARQIRLRNLAGQILIDFVSVEGARQRQSVLDALARATRPDPQRPHILGWTRLGLVEMTRRRRRPPLAELLLTPARRHKTPLTVALEALAAVERGAPARPVLRLHPSAQRMVDGPAAEARRALEARLGTALTVLAEEALDPEAWDLSSA